MRDVRQEYMPDILTLPYENPRAQCIVMLFAALTELGGAQTKQDVLHFICGKRWFEFVDDDHKPYPSATTREERWKCLIAWARKDAVERHQMFRGERDAWELNRIGKDSFASWQRSFLSGDMDSRVCFLWSIHFKTYMRPSYIKTEREWPRPLDIYRDIFAPRHRSIRDRVRHRILDDL